MGEWLIYGSNGVAKATVKKLEYNGEFMGETIVTCDVYSPSPISFSVGDYLSYRGESFVIDYDATRKKQSRVNTYGKGFVYEGMKFTSYVGELKKCDFLDFVLNDNLQHYSQLPTFDFYAETVEALADRLQANLNRMYIGSKAWTVSVVSGFEGKENVNVQISNIKCFDALKMAYEQFNAQYVIRGRHIYIGTAGSSLETTFRYGIGNGLKTIERSVDENDSLVTRLRAYGNTTNLPSNYYANKGRGCYAPIFEVFGIYDSGADIHFKPKFANNWFTEKSGSSIGNYWVSVSLDKILWLDGVASPNASNSGVDFSVISVSVGYGNNTQEMWAAFKAQLQSATHNTKLYFIKGVNYTNWKNEWKETDEYMPNMMSIDRLMIPSFPEESTDPYIDSANISSLGIREKSVYFDGSEDELPDIHPSMEGMTAAELRAAGYTIDLDQGDNGNLDEIAADATELDGSAITTNGAFVEVNEVPGFKVTLKDIGFDINSYLSGDTATLSMKSGMCGGRDFTIVKVTKLGNKYVLECQRVEDANYYFPYNPYNIKAGDKFVLTNIEMPDAYIDAASQRLLVAAQEYLAKHSVPQWVYSIKMDDVWMQRQRDDSESESTSYYWNIKEGDVMSVQDTDLGINVSEVIDRLTIREGYDPIPSFEVVLRKEKPQGTIGVLQNRIKNLERQNQQQTNTIIRQQDYISLIIGDKLNTIQEQLDHVQVTYFGDYVPTLSNEPASTWQSSEYSEHDGDMFYNRESGKGYEFTYQNGSWGWIEIQDEDIRQALEEAAAAQDTADGKRRIFVTPAGTLPTPPYDESDLWVNATYPQNNSVTDESQHKYYNDILKCIVPRAEGATASINDWTLASKYTDDSSLNAFISGTYAQNLQDIQTQVDGKAETWYQATDPSTAWTTPALKTQHKGDIWHNSSNTTINGVKAGQDAIWNGTSWVVDETVPQAVYDSIDGKAAIYVTWGAWGNDLQVKDLFIPSANTTQGGVTYYANKVYRCTNKSTPTFQEINYTDDAALNAFLNGYTGTLTGIRGDITTAQTTANNAATAASNANTAAAAAQATADALDYLKQAYSADNTLIDHGLILSTIVALRDSSNNVWSGISGAYDSTKLGNGIAAWYGGGMIDKEVSAVSNAAKSLFRFDGSGYVANGNLKWDANGNVTIQGYSINATTLQVGGSNVATQAMLDNFISKAFFNRLFTAYDANGNAIVPNDTTTAISNLKILVGTWTEQYLSALGLNSQGGGGGGAGTVTGIIIGSGNPILPDSNGSVTIPAYPSLSGYATQSWVNSQGFVTSSGVTSVAMTVPTGLSVSGSPITSTGTLALTFTSGYSIPTTAKQGNWDTAYGWGNHATAGYASASSVSTLQGYFTNGVANTAAKLSTVSKKIWGQTYWTSGGIPTDVDGTLTINAGEIQIWNTADTSAENRWDMRLGWTNSSSVFTMWAYEGGYRDLLIGTAYNAISANKGLYYDGTNSRWGIGTSTPAYTLDVKGNIGATGSISLIGTTTGTRRIYFGDTDHYIERDANGYFHFSHGIYSDSFVSALGANSSGGGGGVDLTAVWASLTNTENPTYSTTLKINTNHIPSLAASKITSGTFDAARIPDLSWTKITSDKPTTLSGYGVLADANGRYYALYGGTAISATSSSHADLNTYTSYGSYYCSSNATADYVDNLPTTTTDAFRLWVSSAVGTGTTYLRQRFQYYTGTAIYERTSSNGGSSWNSWYLVQYNLANYASASDVTTLQGYFTNGVANSATSATTASKLSTVSKTAWGQTYWTSGGIPATISGNMTDVGNITMEGNITSTRTTTTATYFKVENSNGGVQLYTSTNRGVYDSTTSTWIIATGGTNTFLSQGNVGIGTTAPAYKLHVNGTLNASGAATLGSTLSVTGASTLTGDITAGGGIYLANNKNIYAKDTNSTDRSIMYLSTNNNLVLGYGTIAASTNTYIYGTSLYVRIAGTAATNNALVIDSSKNATFSGFVDVAAGSTTTLLGYKVAGGTVLRATSADGNTILSTPGGSGVINFYPKGSATSSSRVYIDNSGNLFCPAEVTSSSDERKKDIVSDTKFTVKDIASSRSILYEWKDDDKKVIHGGSIAQDWLGKADSFLMQDEDGFYSINYGALALCSAITIARETLRQGDEIERLKQKVSYLENKVRELEERRVA